MAIFHVKPVGDTVKVSIFSGLYDWLGTLLVFFVIQFGNFGEGARQRVNH